MHLIFGFTKTGIKNSSLPCGVPYCFIIALLVVIIYLRVNTRFTLETIERRIIWKNTKKDAKSVGLLR